MKKLLLACVLALSMTGCSSEPKLNKQVVYVEDVGVYELHHRFADTYLLHRLDTDKMKKAITQIEEATNAESNL